MSDPRTAARRRGLRRDDRHLGGVEGADHGTIPATPGAPSCSIALPAGLASSSSSAVAAARPRRGTLAERFRLTGVDLSAEQLRRAREREFPVPTSSTPTSRRSSSRHGLARRGGRVLRPQPRSRGSCSPPLFGRVHAWLRPGRALPRNARRDRSPGLDGRLPRALRPYFAGFPPETNRRLLARRRARRSSATSVVTIREPEGDGDLPLGPGTAMSCSFSLDHYRELLAAARGGGYRFAHFDRAAAPRRPPAPPRRRPLARRSAADGRARGRGGASATYFLMTESVFYNLASSEGVAALARLRELGHRVGLHAVYPHAVLDERLRPRRRLAQPRPRVHDGARRGRRQRHAGGVLRPDRPTAPTRTSTGAPAARTRSCGAAPSRGCSSSRTPRSGSTRAPRWGETMRAMLDAERERRLAQLADDRIDLYVSLRPITVLVSASGAPGTAALLRGLRENGEREVRLVGTDMSRALGRAPPLRRVPPRPGRLRPRLSPTRSSRSSSASASTSSCRSPRSTSRGSRRTASASRCPCSSPSPDAIHRSNDKAETYAFLHRLGVPAPAVPPGQRRRARSTPRRASSATPTGRSASSRCSRPGSRGFRVLDPTVDRAHQLLHERPGSVAMRLEEARRAAPARGRPRPARDGARDGRRAHDRRHRRRRAASSSATRRPARRCAPGSRCTSSRSTTRR